jgi:cysteinyl-tRNA synthetase
MSLQNLQLLLTRQKEAFVPLTRGKVSIYVCGPTVYDNSTLATPRPRRFDVVVRYLRYRG